MRSSVCLFLFLALSQSSFAQIATETPSPPIIYLDSVDVFTDGFTRGHGWNPIASNAPIIDILKSKHYRKQIEFSEDQNKEYMQLQKDYGKSIQDIYSKYPELKRKDLPKAERKLLNQKVMLEQKELKKEFNGRVEETLVPHQVSMIKSMRFKQQMQIFGFAYAVSNAPFSEDLKTTDDQKKKLAKINVESQAEIQRVTMEMQKKVTELKAKAKAKMKKAFSAKQRKLLEEIEGEEPEKAKENVYFGAIR